MAHIDVHDLCVPGRTGNAHAVIGLGTGRSCNSRAVKGVAGRVWQPRRIVVRFVFAGKIDAMHVIDEPVIVVIDAVAGYLVRIRPHVGTKILMAPFAATVHYRDHNPRQSVLALDRIPRLRQMQQSKSRLIGKSWIIRIHAPPVVRLRPVNRHRLGVHHARGRCQIICYVCSSRAGGIANVIRTPKRQKVATSLRRWLHVVQKREYALNQMDAVTCRPPVKLR